MWLQLQRHGLLVPFFKKSPLRWRPDDSGVEMIFKELFLNEADLNLEEVDLLLAFVHVTTVFKKHEMKPYHA
jgi:hypothetical protein